MTYNDIATPIRKVTYGEADIIYTFLTAHHGKVDAIAKGIRKSTSRKRGNIDMGIFSTLQFIEGKNLDIITEAQMLEYNDELFTSEGLKFLFAVMPLVNKFATDKEHSIKIFDVVKRIFLTYENNTSKLHELQLKYELLEIQNILPDWTLCSICHLHLDNISAYSTKSHILVCNNCKRKIEAENIQVPRSEHDLEKLSAKEQEVILDILNYQIKHQT